MKKLIIDLDDTLTVTDSSRSYAEKEADLAMVARLHEYRRQGFEIVIQTARNMRTYAGNIGKINVHTLPTIIAWLNRHDVPFDEIHVGKPWCGKEGFYIDDKAIRPQEFLDLSPEEIRKLLNIDR